MRGPNVAFSFARLTVRMGLIKPSVGKSGGVADNFYAFASKAFASLGIRIRFSLAVASRDSSH